MTIEMKQNQGHAIDRGPSITTATSVGDSTAGSVYHDARGCLTCLAHFTGTAAATVDYEIFDCVSATDTGVSLESGTVTLDASGDGHLSAPAWSGVYLRFELTSATDVAVTIVSH